ncbi:hypothetical protein K491DRAFT_510017 [Lophiostoma macrostomum CBS 122681]|uniref:Fork-head domain-containing protein n=1 Tax=Lophiostoma macrostomum CBS 122681 TaxID=1314788 RepID=A0A6A6T1J1_9PLEO|nr:hypothetical protein K491DRAFT_510017 [Lophiostoma macrostomum CBS 122681]
MDVVTDAPLPGVSGHGSAHHRHVLPASPTDLFTTPPALPDMEVATDDNALAAIAPAPVAGHASPPGELPTIAPGLQNSALFTANGFSAHAEATHPYTSFPIPGEAAILDAPVLDAPISLGHPMNENVAPSDFTAPDNMTADLAPAAPPQQRLSAFARLRFSDGSYYMHTYQIVLGRNVDLAQRDMERLAMAKKYREKGKLKKAEAIEQGKTKKPDKRPRSVISEAGGIVSAPMSAMPADYQQRRQSLASHSISSSSHPKGDSSQDEPVDQAPQHVIMQAFEEVPDQLDSFVPEDPNDCPLVPIHPQHITATHGVRGPKGISREHAKIFYNFEKGTFEIEVIGSNGIYHEDQFHATGDVVELNHGDTIVIGMVEMSFFLPDVALTESQRARQESGSRPMSFSFENGQGEVESEDIMSDDSVSEEVSVDPRHLFHMPVSHYSSDEDAMDEEDKAEEDDDEDDEPSTPQPRRKKVLPKQKIKLKLKNKAQMPPPRKDARGPYKRKAVREPTPDEPVAKKIKTKPKPAEKEPPKEKGKTPAKAPAKGPVKAPVKEPAPAKPKEKPEPAEKVPIADIQPIARRPTAEDNKSGDEGETEGTITSEMIKRHNLPESLLGFVMEKRKGPGRPPKDGVMSKRQRAQLVKQGKEIEKAKAAGIDPTDLPIPTAKPKAPRPRKESTSNMEEGEDDVRETTEKGDGTTPLGDKKMKTNKPARTPSPAMKLEDYTEEQLQRPSANYVVLIHEAISASETGQMNLQQIYNYIEKKYPWYKFKTTTSGWQSSVRHNLGQHDAFVKGDKEGKGFNWKINPEVSIEKERRKRQVSPQATQAPRQSYYPPPPNGYAPYGHPGAYYPPVPVQGAPSGAPHTPANVEAFQPRLPPSLARSAAAAATPAPQGPSNATPYASPWAGGKTAGSPPNQNPPRPFPQSSSHTPPVSAPAPSGQYGVLFPSTAPQGYGSYSTTSVYGNQYATAGATSYSSAPNGLYTPYPTAAPPVDPRGTPYVPNPPEVPPGHVSSHTETAPTPHPSGRYPISTNAELISQLEAFRAVYLEKTQLPRPEEETKVDNAIRALVYPNQTSSLTQHEQQLMKIIANIETIQRLGLSLPPKATEVIKSEAEVDSKPVVSGPPAEGPKPNMEASQASAASTAAAMAASNAVVAASHQQKQPPSGLITATPTDPQAAAPLARDAVIPQSSSSTVSPVKAEMLPQAFMPNMMAPSVSSNTSTTPAVPSPVRMQTSRPSVEPLTPVPGSPAVANPPPSRTVASDIKLENDTAAGAVQDSAGAPRTDDSTS